MKPWIKALSLVPTGNRVATLPTNPGVALGVDVGVGVGIGAAVGLGLDIGVGIGVEVGVTAGVGAGVGEGVGVAEDVVPTILMSTDDVLSESFGSYSNPTTDAMFEVGPCVRAVAMIVIVDVAPSNKSPREQ